MPFSLRGSHGLRAERETEAQRAGGPSELTLTVRDTRVCLRTSTAASHSHRKHPKSQTENSQATTLLGPHLWGCDGHGGQDPVSSRSPTGPLPVQTPTRTCTRSRPDTYSCKCALTHVHTHTLTVRHKRAPEALG